MKTIAADKWLKTYAEKAFNPDGPYTLSRETLQQLLRAYGKEIVLKCAERADVTGDELGQPIVNQSTILQIMDEL